MEMELQRSCLNGYRIELDQTILQEETLEGIVPDIYPDMSRIIGTSGQILLQSNDVSTGNLRINGVAQISILYVPDEEQGPRHLDVSLPFFCSLDDTNLNGKCKLYIVPRLCSVDAHLINPRKYLVRAEIAVEVQVYLPMEKSICTCVADADNLPDIQQKTETEETYLLTAFSEKAFQFSEVLDLPSSHMDVHELLQSRVLLHTPEAKVIGGKLILKGEAELNVLCRSDDGSVFSEMFSVPYSQILELNGVGEDCDVKAGCYMTELDCSLQAGSSSSIILSLALTAQAVIGERKSISVLTDLYSTSRRTEPNYEMLAVHRIGPKEHMTESIRQFCECGIPAKRVVDTNVSLGRVTETKENGSYHLNAECTAVILFYSEDDVLCSAAYQIPVKCEQPAMDELQCSAVLTGKSSALSVYGGFEVRFETEFTSQSRKSFERSCVCGAHILPDEERHKDEPSIMLRIPTENEELWEIAKSCKSTVRDIVAVNKLETENAPAGQILLIPRCR